MNRCVNCGRNIKNAETSYGLEFCKYCEKYEQQLDEKNHRIKVLERALYNLAIKCEKESCYTCPAYYLYEDYKKCPYFENGNETDCHKEIMRVFISQVEKEIEDGNK